MANLAQSAVLVSSHTATEALGRTLTPVRGPSEPHPPLASLLGEHMAALGFQASHFAQACALAGRMITPQPRSKTFVIQDEQFVRLVTDAEEEDAGALHYPRLFLGLTANLLGTGCRDAVRFLVKEGCRPRGARTSRNSSGGGHDDGDGIPVSEESDYAQFLRLNAPHAPAPSDPPPPPPPLHSFVSVLVVSGGAMEHDLRRACLDYTCTQYSSEGRGAESGAACFGNVCYPRSPAPSTAVFDALMRLLVAQLVRRQEHLRGAAAGPQCSWRVTPSQVWALAGVWLEELLLRALTEVHGGGGALRSEARRRAESTVLYWAARQEVPIYCPSLVDGDVMAYVLAQQPLLEIDLVADIHALNKFAMLSPCTGILVCGGGVVKHHICNANLMRNGADFSIFINNGQEFDGSDGGAKPEEAISWGKIRIDGDAVKVYAEITAVLPLLVAQVFLPAAREAHASLAPTTDVS